MKKKTIRVPVYTVIALFYCIYFFTLSWQEKLYGGSIIVNSFLLILPLAIFCLFFSSKGKLAMNYGIIGWLLFLIPVIFHNVDFQNGVYTGTIVWILTVITMLVLSQSDTWFDTFNKAVLTFTTIFAVGTIAIFAIPSIYPSIRTLLINDVEYIQEAGYKSGLTIHYSTNGIYLAYGVITCFCNILFPRRKSKRNIILFFVLFLALLLTTKRAHFLFSVISILIVYYAFLSDNRRSRPLKVGLVITLSILGFIIVSSFFPVLNEVILRFFNEKDVSNGRWALYAIATRNIKENFLLGIGWRGFRYEYFNAYGRINFYSPYADAHNVYLQVLCECGIVFFVLYVFLSFKSAYDTYKLFSSFCEKQGSEDYYSRALAISLSFQLFFLMYCLTGNPLYDSLCFIPYMISCAITYRLNMSYRKSKILLGL